MARVKIEIRKIEDKAKRHTTFTKRRQGLMKKAQDIADKFEAEAAVITFSKAGNVFAFGHPSVDSLVTRYLAESSSGEEETEIGGGSIEEEGKGPVQAALTEEGAENMICQALERGSWEVAVEGLGPREIDELAEEIVRVKRVVAARASEIAAREASTRDARSEEM